jgi:hypothetical protein
MAVLDQLRKKDLVPTPVTVNSDWASPSASLDDRQGPFSLVINYENGVSVDIEVKVQMSPDNINWADVDDTQQTHTDSSGMAYYDINGSGTQWVRLYVTVNAGSIDIVSGEFSAFKAHQ